MSIKKLNPISHLFILLFSIFSYANTLESQCVRSINAVIPECKKLTQWASFEESKKQYALVYAECKIDDFETSQLVLVHKDTPKNCPVLQIDTSFVGYMFDVDEEYKAKISNKIFEKAIMAEVKYLHKSKDDLKKLVLKLKNEKKTNDITKDREWLLNTLTKELGI